MIQFQVDIDKFGRGGTLNDPTLGVQSGYEERLIKIKMVKVRKFYWWTIKWWNSKDDCSTSCR